MSNQNNIVIISTNENFSEKIAEKIILLRKTDNVITAGYQNALHIILAQHVPVTLLIADDKEKTVSLIKDLKNYTSIILLTENEEIIPEAFDAGITDFCSENAPDYELCIRVVNGLKNSLKKLDLQRAQRLLVQNDMIDKNTGFYSYKSADFVINNEINTRALKEGIFAVIAPSDKAKTFCTKEKLTEAVRMSVREDDIVIAAKGLKIYLLLPYTEISGAEKVLAKIKANCPDNFDIKAGFCDINGKDFTQLEREGLKAFLDAMYSENAYSISDLNAEPLSDWIDEPTSNTKNYKIFRQLYNKKLTQVIRPVLYRLQQECEVTMPDTEIFQYADEQQAVFHIKSRHQESKLKIVYPGMAKILLYTIHKGLESPENQEISLALSKLTTIELTEIAENFINEFKSSNIE